MKTVRKTAVLVVGFMLGVSGVVSPVWADPIPSTVDRPVLADPVKNPRPAEAVPKDQAGRVLLYVDGQQESDLRDAVAKVGGEVSAAQGGKVQAAVPLDKLDEFARQPAVQNIRRPERAIPMAVTSEGVAASGADGWIRDGKRGAGVKIGIIDVGFDGLADAQDAGELPATGPQLALNTSGCHDVTKVDDHGTAIAEIVHDTAPDASLFLACIDGPLDFAPAAEWLRQQGVQVITAAVGFLSSGRGDGTGELNSPADVVKRTREAGIFWSVAAGNLAQHHFANRAVDANGNGFVEFSGTTENNGFNLAAGRQATVGLRWDAWPRTTEDLDVYVMKSASPPTGSNDPNIMASSVTNQRDVVGGAKPTEEVTFTNDAGFATAYFVYVKNNTGRQTTSYDLFVSGGADQLQLRTEAGSVTEPATSAYAMAVGATQVGSGQLQRYSAQGPTVDGRQKPDLVGFAPVSTSAYTGQVFGGTSAAAAHVAGAAAILKSANPQLDASQLQAALQAKANPKKSDNQWGSGTLALGTPDTVPVVTGKGYTSLSEPKRLQDKQYTAGELFTLPIPGLPTDATAVVLTLAADASEETSVEVFPKDPAQTSGKGNALRAQAGGFTSLTVIATLGADQAVRIRNTAGNTRLVVEMLGYFSTNGASYFPKATPQRVLDTRGLSGSPRTGHLSGGESYALQVRGVAGVPANATAVAVSVTGFEASGEAWIGAYTKDWPGTSTTMLHRGERQTNLAFVGIADDGKIRLKDNNSSGTVGVAVDVVGWFAPGDGARYVALPEPARVIDTVTGTGLRSTPIGHGETATFQVGGMAGVSASATAAVLTVTGAGNELDTELSAVATEAGWTPVTSVGVPPRQRAAGAVVTPLGASGKVDVRNESGQTHITGDALGYFVGGQQITDSGQCALPRGEIGFTSVLDARAETGSDAWLTAGGIRPQIDGCELVTSSGNTGVTWYGAHTYRNDYTVKLDWKDATGNTDSGVFVGFPNPGTDGSAPEVRGVEVQIRSNETVGVNKTGAIAGFRAPTADAAKPVGEWNAYEITFAGNKVTVLLNGRQVNEYTITDSARLNQDTFIGLQNSGDRESTRFRNIRIKRNSSFSSGTLVGLNNKCLGVTGGNTTGSDVSLSPCNSRAEQVWTTQADGSLRAFGRCLAVSGDGNDSPVGLTECNNWNSQQWTVRTDNSVYNTQSAKCLTATSGTDGAKLVIRDCADQSQQQWRPSVQSGREGALMTASNPRCLSVPGSDPNAVDLTVAQCNGQIAQVWTMNGDGTARSMGKCLGVGGTANGTAAKLGQCDGSSNQQWMLDASGSLVHPVSGRCLVPSSVDAGALLTIQDCSKKPEQSWKLARSTVTAGRLLGLNGRCLQVSGLVTSRWTARLENCGGGNNQSWSESSNGTLTVVGRCLDVLNAGTSDNTSVGVWPCSGSQSQQWVRRPDGSLVNPASGRCLDAGADGNNMVILQCGGVPQQRWTILKPDPNGSAPAVVGGWLYHQLRTAEGPWTTNNLVQADSGLTSVAASAVNGDLHVVSVVGGQRFHQIRYADGRWTTLNLLGNEGVATSVSIAGYGDGTLQVATVIGGRVYHQLRRADGLWTANVLVVQVVLVVTQVAVSAVNGDFHLVGLVGGQRSHMIRYADGSWSSFNLLGNEGVATSVSIAGYSNGTLQTVMV